jgi:hypothetical protein
MNVINTTSLQSEGEIKLLSYSFSFLCLLGLLNKVVQLHISQNTERLNLWIINWEARGKTPRNVFLRCYPSICWRMSKTTMGLMNVGIQTEDKTTCIQNPLQSPQSINHFEKVSLLWTEKSCPGEKSWKGIILQTMHSTFFLSKLKFQTQNNL